MHTPLSETSTASCEGSGAMSLKMPPIMDRYGNAADIGHKSRMEDTSMCVPFSGGGGAFGVFDGHGGAGAAEFIKDYMRNVILKSLDSSRDKEDTLSRSYSLTEEALERFLCETEMPKLRACFDDDFVDDDDYPLMTSGSTACVCLVDESTSPGSLAVANAGDCRAVLCRRGEAINLTRDHNLKSCTEDERRRVAPYLPDASSEYLGGLAVTRSLGDLRASSGSKNAGQIAEPEITSMPLEKDDEFIILATDGLFDVLSSETAVETVRRHMLGSQSTPATAARYLIDRAIARHAADNICVTVVYLRDWASSARPSSTVHISEQLTADGEVERRDSSSSSN
ncbi:protein phosphatase 2C, putative [Perkinsus marinus ATCC 50983]|uniref:Protein phosphatase 2C, putative n=1 Tax=Perkinsus marinus (strain ATCC 50983 / TXsc) TaxID=423536 RepID=C5L0W0_PERM5|nr:protein phosphatase 2C, putative [Perkinsus marinus ATCC 50983]EER09602.1 protein phosphatase 2C, putative [Perkinsus marinus ATCC 50983]|eukprot:XP_002777807.1 protein phosphatase 2C, putative [Perkinsus marinus ATCC 50983]